LTKRKPIVVYVNPDKPDYTILERIGEKVRAGALVVYPTDTVYGIGTTPFDVDAVRRVFEAKKRPLGKPVPVLVSGIDVARRLVDVTYDAEKLMRRFWPGGLTIVLRAKPDVPSIVHGGTGKVGVRMPNHKVALILIEKSGGALVGTSANIHRQPPPKTAEEAIEQLGDHVDYVIDSGLAPGGKPSTVIDLTMSPPRIVRRGPVTREDIESVLGVEVVE
jgi:L-threonylcarbamoyladenylate synthase